MGYTILLICSAILILLLVYGYMENDHLKVERYELETRKIKKSLRIVFLTDLHANEHGRENYKLVSRIRKENPDILCVTGDMVVKNGVHTERVLSLLKRLSQDYPVYYSPGNHEIRLEQYEEYKDALLRFGVHYLENKSVFLPDYNIRITGLDLPEYWYHKVWDKRVFTVEEMNSLVPMEETEKPALQLLMAHNPEYFPTYQQWGADLTLSGHIHGGIAILPFLGGVLSPSLRIFPKYDQGLKKENEKYILISRGLGLHHIKLRFFNPPELSVINLSCQAEEK